VRKVLRSRFSLISRNFYKKRQGEDETRRKGQRKKGKSLWKYSRETGTLFAIMDGVYQLKN
ncbi:hypothetical protein AKJ65_06775, partial [candidate division MSBL1 archaeon SCGC-AAA259E19]